jgi:hypothetical protein
VAKDVDMEKMTKGDFSHLLGLPGFPEGKTVRRVLIGGARPENLTIYLAALAASAGFKVVVADGANAFDPYVVAKFARKEGIPEDELLKKIAVARGFTCHQVSTLVRERLEPMIPSGVAPFIVLLGPGNLFFDEDVPGEEAALLFRRMMVRVAEMSRKGFFFLMGQSFSKGNRQRSFLLRELADSADAVLKLKPEADTLQVVMDKPRMTLRKPWEAFEEFRQLMQGRPAG